MDPSPVALLVADVYELAGALRRRGDELAGSVGQTQARWQVLSVMSTGDRTVSDGARRLGVSRQAVQRVADALAADGLVRFEANPTDRRAPLVQLTAPGRRALTTISEEAQVWHRDLEARLGAEELAELHRSVRHLLAAVADTD